MSTDSEWSNYKVDASANGCTGMFYRTKCAMSASSNDKDWPRNGTILQGKPATVSGWVELKNGYFLPIAQNGVTVTHLVNKDKQ